MEGNPYAEVSPVSAIHGESDGEWGIAQATLAYEQRTANLIAWTTANGTEPAPWIGEEIRARLGLTDEVAP